MCTVLRDDLIVTFGTVVGLLTIVNTVDVRLSYGQAHNQGQVEVRRHDKETWGKVCDLNFREEEAAVVCRQLNYKYARNDKGVYFPDYPDYRLENLNCNGNESELSECIEGEWKTSIGLCDVKRNAYASVCCSNSPDFGETRDGLFVSHCADYWIDAEEKCEENKGTLASSDEYKAILGSAPEDTQDDDAIKGYWIKKFFTPWMWSNGCFEFKNNISFDHQEFNLQNNTAQACLQMCSIASPPTSFLLSENLCRCIPTESLKSYITEVLPGWCNIQCAGDSAYFCGSSSRRYWSLYTIALESIFYRISDPSIIEHRQCAVLEASRKLSSEGCYHRNGYICGQILQENSSMPRLLYFQDNRFYEVFMLEARKKCTSDDSTMRLMGEKILEQDIRHSQQYSNLWVDISRLLSDVYTIYWEPENRKDTSLWRNLEPKWCFARLVRGSHYSDEVTHCHTRFRYICSIYDKKDQISNSDGSSAENDTDKGTEYSHNNSNTEVHIQNVTIQVYSDHTDNSNNVTFTFNTSCHAMVEEPTLFYFLCVLPFPNKCSMVIVIVAVICGLLVVVAIVSFLWIYKRSSKNGLWNICCQKEPEYQEEQSLQNEYTATVACNTSNASSEHIYAEMKSENIYHEPDTPLAQRDPGVQSDITEVDILLAHSDSGAKFDLTDLPGGTTSDSKEPVTIKRSYSSPKDLANSVEGSENQDFKDPNYIYPYDKVHRSETKPTEFAESKVSETDKNEIMDNQSKDTVV